MRVRSVCVLKIASLLNAAVVMFALTTQFAFADDLSAAYSPPFDPLETLALWRSGGSDVDGDGVPDDDDNCVEIANPNQIDTDADGFGNLCDGDLDNSGFVNLSDLALIRVAFFSNPTTSNWNPDADFNSDDVVNIIDLAIIGELFFAAPGPITNTFINEAGGDWHDPANWSRGVVPNATHAVRIDLEPGTIVEYSAGASDVASVRTTSELLLSGGELKVVGTLQVNAPFTITGGELLDAFVLAPLTEDALMLAGSADFDRVILESDLTITDGQILRIHNTLTLDGSTVSLASTGLSTILRFVSPSNGNGVYGTGEIVFNGPPTLNAVSRVDNVTASDVTFGAGITLRVGASGGDVIITRGVLTIEGTVISDTDGLLIRLRTIVAPGADINMFGDVVAQNGGSVSLTSASGVTIDGTVIATGGGDIELGSETGPYSISAASVISVTDARLDLSGPWVNEGTINVTNGVFDTGDDSAQSWDNNGVITLVSTVVELGGEFSVPGLGDFNSDGDVFFDGSYDNVGETLDLGTVMFPDNFIFDGGEIRGGSLVTTPLVLPSGRSLGLNGVTLMTDVVIGSGSSLLVSNTLTLDDATISFASEGLTSVLRFTSSSTANGLAGTGEAVFGVDGKFGGRSGISCESGVSATLGAGITLRTNTHAPGVSGCGEVFRVESQIISDVAGAEFVLGGVERENLFEFSGTAVAMNGGSIKMRSAGGSTIIDGDITVTGGGDLAIDGAVDITADSVIRVTDGRLDMTGGWTNSGLIDVTNGEFDTGISPAPEWTNAGVINLLDTPLELGGSFTVASLGLINTNGEVTFTGELDNTGQALDVGNPFPDHFPVDLAGGLIRGGSLVTTVVDVDAQGLTLRDVTLEVDSRIRNGAKLVIIDTLILDDARVTLEAASDTSQLQFEATTTAGSQVIGTGDLVFRGTAGSAGQNKVEGGFRRPLTIGPGVTVRTEIKGGRFRAVSAPLTIQGTLISNVPGERISLFARSFVVIQPDTTLEGTVQVGPGAEVFFESMATLTPTASVQLDIGGIDRTQYGALVSDSMPLVLSGEIELSLVDGFVPALDDRFDVIRSAAIDGEFETESGTDIGGGVELDVIYNANSVTVEAVPAN